MNLTTRGLVIRVTPYRDYDRLISVLTEDRGRLFFMANAVRSVTNPNASACNLFAYSEFLLRQKQDRYYLHKAQLLEQPLGFSCDVETLAAAAFLAELCDDVARDEEGARIALHLCTNALSILKKNDRETDVVLAVFALRLLSAVGFLPQLVSCGNCGAEVGDKAWFEPSDGTLLCAACAKGSAAFMVSPSCVALAQRTVSVPEKEAYALRLPQELQKEFSAFSQNFLLAQMQREFATLDYYHKIKGLS